MQFFGEFEEQYRQYGPRMRRKRAPEASERRRRSMPYMLLTRTSHRVS